MTPETDASTMTVLASPAVRARALRYEEGVIAGVLGAATVALWFLLVDAVNGRPLYTPTVLGTVLFRHGDALAALDTVSVSLEMAALYTVAHVLIFSAIGSLASRLLVIAERHPEVGFGILVLFVVFEFAVTVSPILFAASLVCALTWPALLIANLLATAAMAGYLWHRHPTLRIRP